MGVWPSCPRRIHTHTATADENFSFTFLARGSKEQGQYWKIS